MSTYVIARRGTEFLDTPVFYVGPSAKERAIAVFTDCSAAQRYIGQASWADDHEVGELDDLQLLRCTIKAHGQGTQYLAIDPDRNRQLAGKRQEIIVIEEKLAAFAEWLTRDILRFTQQDVLS
jgi:hypothetical protein